MIACNPTVKLEKGEKYNLVDIDSIQVGTRYVKGKELQTFEGKSGCRFQNGDTVMARITPCLENGKIAQIQCESEKGFGSTELLVFRGIKDKTDSDYVFSLMSTEYIRNLSANSMSGASGRQRADLSFIKNIKWDFPSLSVQQRIASILNNYDKLIQNYQKQIEDLQNLAGELYKEWFVRFRFPGHEKASFENGIPAGWKYVKISTAYNSSSGGTPSRQCLEYYENGIYPWIKTGELKDSLILESEEYITESAIQNSSAKLFEKDSLIIAMYGATIGQIGINKMQATCNQACCVLRPKDNVPCGIYYLYMFFLFNRNYLISLGSGAAQQNLSQVVINKLNFLLPKTEVIEQFEKLEKSIFDRMCVFQKKISVISKQRDLLLPRLMSGKLEVK